MEHSVDLVYMSNDNFKKENAQNAINVLAKKILYPFDNESFPSKDIPNSKYENPECSKLNYFAKKRISLYKTEMCRSHEETGVCKYGDRCQFAHEKSELRPLNRHPRYKTETCKTFWEIGTCPYGKRCCFVHLENKNLIKKDSKSDYNNIDAHKIEDEIHCFLDESPILEENDLLIQSTYCKADDYIYDTDDLEESDDIFFNKIELSDNNFDIKKEMVKNLLINDVEIEENIELQASRPFWSKNQACIWVPDNKMFCYIKKHKMNFNGTFGNQSKAPGELFIIPPSSDIAEFVIKKLGL